MLLRKDKDVRKLLAAYNATMQRVDAELNVAFVGEVLSEDFPPSAFIDNGHFNEAGLARFAFIPAKSLEQHPNIR